MNHVFDIDGLKITLKDDDWNLGITWVEVLREGNKPAKVAIVPHDGDSYEQLAKKAAQRYKAYELKQKIYKNIKEELETTMNGIADIEKHLDKTYEKVSKDWEKRIEPFIEKAKQSIKHPHFYYAVVDTKNMTIKYERKKWYKWLSGKRIACIKIQPIESPGLANYYPTKKTLRRNENEEIRH